MDDNAQDPFKEFTNDADYDSASEALETALAEDDDWWKEDWWIDSSSRPAEAAQDYNHSGFPSDLSTTTKNASTTGDVADALTELGSPRHDSMSDVVRSPLRQCECLADNCARRNSCQRSNGIPCPSRIKTVETGDPADPLCAQCRGTASCIATLLARLLGESTSTVGISQGEKCSCADHHKCPNIKKRGTPYVQTMCVTCVSQAPSAYAEGSSDMNGDYRDPICRRYLLQSAPVDWESDKQA